jgi:hypothetical protein
MRAIQYSILSDEARKEAGIGEDCEELAFAKERGGAEGVLLYADDARGEGQHMSLNLNLGTEALD